MSLSTANANTDTLLFESIGEMVAGLSYSHTIVAIPIHQLQDQILEYHSTLCREFNDTTLDTLYNDAMKNLSRDEISATAVKRNILRNWKTIGYLHKQEVEEVIERVTALMNVLPSELPSQMSENRVDTMDEYESDTTPATPGKRPRRAIGLIIGAIAGIALGGTGTLFGTMGLANSNRLRDQVDALSDKVYQLEVDVSRHGLILQEVQAQLQTVFVVNALKDAFDPAMLLARLRTHFSRLDRLVVKHEMLLQALQNRRISTTFLAKEKVDQIFLQAQRRAKSLGCQLLLSNPSHLTQLEVSHFYNGTYLNLILHIPIAPANSIMRLFKLHPFPLPFANDTFLIPDVRNDVLAVSNTNVRFSSQMSSLELQSCSRVNKIYLCERNGVMNKFPEDTCLGALYHQKFDLAKSICQFHVEPAREFIYQLLNNWFLIYVMAPVTVPVTCQDKNHFEWHLKAGITRQHLPAGCTADLPRNLLLSDLSILVPQDYVQFDMEWDPVSFLPDFQSMVLPEFRKISDGVGPSAVSLATLQSIVASRLMVPRFFHPLHFTFNAITFIIVALLAFAGGRYFYQRYRDRQTKLQQANVQRAVQSVLAKRTLSHYNDEIRLPGYMEAAAATPPSAASKTQQSYMRSETYDEVH